MSTFVTVPDNSPFISTDACAAATSAPNGITGTTETLATSKIIDTYVRPHPFCQQEIITEIPTEVIMTSYFDHNDHNVSNNLPTKILNEILAGPDLSIK